MINNKWLIMPIETKVRELYGKLLLSFIAAEAGFHVIIGSKDEISRRAKYLPKGFILNFGLAKTFERSSKLYKEYGHNVIVMDEEGLVTLNDDIYLRYRVSEDTLRQTDLFFCWGDRQAKLVESKAEGTGCKVISSGNPRFDILRFECRSVFATQVEKLKSEYSPMILINTNFGSFNHLNGVDFTIKSLRAKQWMSTPEDEKYHMDRLNFQGRIFKNFRDMLPVLSHEFKNYNIVLRPHPSENHDIWREYTKDLPNVHVLHDGTVEAWILASEVLIHNGCTTAVQAYILDKPVIAYRPVISDNHESKLANSLSEQVKTLNELADKIKDISKWYKQDDCSVKDLLADEYISGRKSFFSSELIVNELNNERCLKNKSNSALESRLFLKAFGIMYRMREIILGFMNKNYFSRHYLKHKFPYLTYMEIQEILREFQKISGKFQRIEVSSIGKSYLIKNRSYEKNKNIL
jgi:surface carbohydrate biosynthesis protein